jgi:hypothetical protein
LRTILALTASARCSVIRRSAKVTALRPARQSQR